MNAFTQEDRERGNAGFRRLSVVQKVFAKVSAGRFKEKAYTPVYALAEACSFRDRVLVRMTEAGLKQSDAATAIVFADYDLTGIYSVKLVPGEEQRVLEKMMLVKAVTVGVVVGLRDHERDGQIMLRAIPFLKGPQALKWLEEVLDREETKKGFVN
jgi:hypothetical protein